ncbi:MAG TPA: hypothetical protein VHV78_14175 [Gemmatimonadaceae bacterium]|nr:hypothetical protein [Gemmatimonadaceae bacterium]
MSEDLKHDLQLATQAQRIQISPDEITPKAHQDLAMRPKKAPNGTKVIRSNHPTVKASELPVEAAEIKTEIPQVQVMASAPAPSESPTPDAPPLARPSPVPAQTYPGAEPIPASNGGSGGILGGIFGAVIRGGIVGGDDHCDPRPRGRILGGDGGGMVLGSPGSIIRGRPF